MEHKIGEIFEYNGEWYQCIKSDSYRCDYCDYGKLGNCNDIACGTDERKDGKEVYFKKLEKTGEPYEYFVQHKEIVMLQPYKLFTIPIVNGIVCNVNYDANTIDLEIKQNKEDMEEKKLNLKPFDLQKAREGKPVFTRDGRKARIICWDKIGNFPIVALVMGKNNKESVFYYNGNGRDNDAIEKDYDLMMLPKKKEGWVNIYKSDNGTYYTGAIFYEKNDALVNTAEIEITTGISIDCIDTVKISWEE